MSRWPVCSDGKVVLMTQRHSCRLLQQSFPSSSSQCCSISAATLLSALNSFPLFSSRLCCSTSATTPLSMLLFFPVTPFDCQFRNSVSAVSASQLWSIINHYLYIYILWLISLSSHISHAANILCANVATPFVSSHHSQYHYLHFESSTLYLCDWWVFNIQYYDQWLQPCFNLP